MRLPIPFGHPGTIFFVARVPLSRRTFLLSTAGAAACGQLKPERFKGYCFVANRDDSAVGVVDLARFRLRKQIPLDAPPDTVIAHPSQPRVFVLASQNGTIYEIDALSLAVRRRMRAGNSAAQMQMSSRGDALWILYRDPPALVEAPLDSFRPRRRIQLASQPDHFDLRDTRAAVANLADRSIVLASLEHSAIERTIAAGAEPSIVRFQADGRQLIAGSRPERSLTIFDVPTGKTVVRMPLSIEPRHFCFSADGGQLYITGEGMDAVVVVYPYQTEVAETVLAGHAPGAMTFADCSPSYLLVANPQDNGISILNFDEMGKKLVATVQVGEQPGYMLTTPDQKYALVLDEKSGDLAVIWLTSLSGRATQAWTKGKPVSVFTVIPVGHGPVSADVVKL